MTDSGDQEKKASTISAKRLQAGLAHLGDVRLRKMFGGYGVFEADTMFALVDSKGVIFFKVDDTNIKRFEDAGSARHARMPYYQVPENVLVDPHALAEWAQASIAAAKNAKK